LENNSKKITQWLCELALANSQAALKSLYVAYNQKLIRFIGLYVSSFVDIEEVLSDTFLALWNNRESLLDVTNFNSYIYGIARHKAISFCRKKQIENVDVEDFFIDLFYHTETTPEDNLISKEEIANINAAINALPEKTKITFKLIREDNLKYKEVAEILGISIKTVEAHMATAVRQLRETLEKKT